MDTQVQNHMFYFGKDTYGDEDSPPTGWVKGWYFRVLIDTEGEMIKLEDTCGRHIPISFENIWELIKTLHSVQDELVASLIGMPRAVS